MRAVNILSRLQFLFQLVYRNTFISFLRKFIPDLANTNDTKWNNAKLKKKILFIKLYWIVIIFKELLPEL